MPNSPFTLADAARMQELADLEDLEERDLTPAEYDEWTALVERWDHAVRVASDALMPADWQPPVPGGPEYQAILRRTHGA